jgi:preprotein translocase subunit SecG
MYGVLLALHIVICFSLIVVVLLQSGKGGGLAGGAFGGTAQQVFGGRGANDFMTRATMVLGGAFFATSLVLALMSSGTANQRSLLQEAARKAATTAPPQVPAPQGQGQPAPGRTPQAPATTPQTPPATTPQGGGK